MTLATKESIRQHFGIDVDSDIFSPIVDYAFKRLFTADEKRSKLALIDFLNSVLEFEKAKPIVDLTVTNPEIPVDVAASKKAVFDIRVKFNDGEQAIVEMQLNSHPDFKKRAQLLISKAYASQPIAGLDFGALRKCYLICVTNFKPLLNKQDFASDYRFRDRQGNDLTDDETIVFVELPKVDGILDKPVEEMTDLEQWAIFFRYVSDKSKREIINRIIGRKEAIRMATDILEVISKDEKERVRYENELFFDLDQRSRVNGARREGRMEGVAEERINIARKMLKRNRPLDEIIEDTGLSYEEIENLLKTD
jgi:predicted transposase/invertase (TIGR01784 family)